MASTTFTLRLRVEVAHPDGAQVTAKQVTDRLREVLDYRNEGAQDEYFGIYTVQLLSGQKGNRA